MMIGARGDDQLKHGNGSLPLDGRVEGKKKVNGGSGDKSTDGDMMDDE